MWYFVLGIVVGIVVACIGVSRLIIGTIRYVRDEDGVYPFMELKNPDISKVFRKKYVVLKVGSQK